jgi:hypothetical protein
VARILSVGLEELATEEQFRLIENMQTAQNELLGACLRAAVDSGRVEPIAPDTPDELFNPREVRFRIHQPEDHDA